MKVESSNSKTSLKSTMSEESSEERNDDGANGASNKDDSSSQVSSRKKDKPLSSEEIRRQSLQSRRKADMLKNNLARDITTPGEKDILLGREPKSWNHEGNRRYREVILKHQKEYHAAAKRCIKTSIVASIVEKLTSEGCRFLKRDKKNKVWHQVDRTTCVEKVGHALRDKQAVAQQRFLRKHLNRNNMRNGLSESNANNSDEDYEEMVIGLNTDSERKMPNIFGSQVDGYATVHSNRNVNGIPSDSLLQLLGPTPSSMELQKLTELQLARDILDGRSTTASRQLYLTQNQPSTPSAISLDTQQRLGLLNNDVTSSMSPIHQSILPSLVAQTEALPIQNSLEEQLKFYQKQRRLILASNARQQESVRIPSSLDAYSSVPLQMGRSNEVLPGYTVSSDSVSLERLLGNKPSEFIM